MSDVDDYYDNDGGYDWLYVEEHYDETDDLAEHTCPSPVAEAEARADDAVDYDPYNYWEDLEYLSDSYYDDRIPLPSRSHPTDASSGKRKRQTSPRKTHPTTKRPRLVSQQTAPTPPLIRWKADVQKDSSALDAPVAQPGSLKTVSLLADWKERFQDAPGLLQAEAKETEPASEDGPGTGIDLNDIQSIAGLLTEENLGQLADALKAKGLDPEAMQVVLQDLLAGREPEFDDEDDAEERDEVGADQMADQQPSASQHGSQANTESGGAIPHRSLKRKTTEDGLGLDADEETRAHPHYTGSQAADSSEGVEVQARRIGTGRRSRAAPAAFAGKAGADPLLAKSRKRSRR